MCYGVTYKYEIQCLLRDIENPENYTALYHALNASDNDMGYCQIISVSMPI